MKGAVKGRKHGWAWLQCVAWHRVASHGMAAQLQCSGSGRCGLVATDVRSEVRHGFPTDPRGSTVLLEELTAGFGTRCRSLKGTEGFLVQRGQKQEKGCRMLSAGMSRVSNRQQGKGLIECLPD